MEEAKVALDNAFNVYIHEEDSINTNNGLLNKEYIEYRKRVYLKKAMTYLTEELVKHKQEFPHNDISEVSFDADFVVLKIEDFLKIKNVIDNIDE